MSNEVVRTYEHEVELVVTTNAARAHVGERLAKLTEELRAEEKEASRIAGEFRTKIKRLKKKADNAAEVLTCGQGKTEVLVDVRRDGTQYVHVRKDTGDEIKREDIPPEELTEDLFSDRDERPAVDKTPKAAGSGKKDKAGKTKKKL